MISFKPMLADDADLSVLKYPVLVSPKLDGVRATFLSGSLVTRSLKPIPNRSVNEVFKSDFQLDGELIVGDPTSPSVFRDTMKVVSAFEADIKDLSFFVFDLVSTLEFTSRLQMAHSLALAGGNKYVCVPHALVESKLELLRLEERTLDDGYEGLMIRDPRGGYKFGRSTVREGLLLKLKQRKQSEAEIIGYEEQMHNANEAKTNLLGYTERSSHQANLVPTGVLGALKVKDCKTNVEFNIGTGFDYAMRTELWKNKEKLVGKIVTYEFLPVGIKDKPRHPVFLGFRMKEDV